jgi:hypothetical protein
MVKTVEKWCQNWLKRWRISGILVDFLAVLVGFLGKIFSDQGLGDRHYCNTFYCFSQFPDSIAYHAIQSFWGILVMPACSRYIQLACVSGIV